MESKQTESLSKNLESLNKQKEMLLKIQQRIADMKASSSTGSNSAELQSITQEIHQALTMMTGQYPNKATMRITYEFNKLFDAGKVGHECNLCSRDLATDPERPNASLSSLQEACVLACGHVYHFKCLRGTTLDLDNSSTDPSCVFCISCSD